MGCVEFNEYTWWQMQLIRQLNKKKDGRQIWIKTNTHTHTQIWGEERDKYIS